MGAPLPMPEVSQRFGRGVVVDPDVRIRDNRRAARMRCDDGTVYVTVLSSLYDGSTRSCGCLQRDISAASAATMRAAKDSHGLAGHPLYEIWRNMLRRCEDPAYPTYPTYGGSGVTVCDRWHDVAVFVDDVERLLGPQPRGKATIVLVHDAGCYEPGNVQWGFHRRPRPGRRSLRSHPLYKTWKGMIYRCENPGAPKFPAYGGSGVSVCGEWRDMWTFAAWVETRLGPRPEGMTLDRIRPDGNYEPGNVRWATSLEQRHNRRDNTAGTQGKLPRRRPTRHQHVRERESVACDTCGAAPGHQCITRDGKRSQPHSARRRALRQLLGGTVGHGDEYLSTYREEAGGNGR